MIYEIEVGKTYYSKSGKPFRVLSVARHAQDCTIPMIVFENLVATDWPAGTHWVLEESLFLKTFTEGQ